MKFQNINKSFKDKKVLENLSFEIKDNSSTALLGKSGSGKTTISRLITGLEKPIGGKIIFNKKEKFSVVFQENRLLPFKTLTENITLIGTDEKTAIKYLTKVGLGNEINSYPDTLSGGMKRRASLARALACPDYTFLILDEPFTGQDDETRKMLIKLIKEETKNKTLLLITHNEEDAKMLCENKITL